MEPIGILHEQKILLLYGGWSAERNISINSGTAVAGALNRNGISFTEYDITCLLYTSPSPRDDR